MAAYILTRTLHLRALCFSTPSTLAAAVDDAICCNYE